MTPANFCASYAWQVTLSFDWLAFAVNLFGGQRTSFTANASQSNESDTTFTANVSQSNESVTSFTVNASQTNESVICARVAGTEVCWCHGVWKLIFTTVEIDFYHHGNFFFPWNFFYRFNKFTQVATALLDLWNFISSSSNKFTQVQPCHHRWPDQWRLQWVGGCLQKSMILLKLIFITIEIDFYHHGSWFLLLWKYFLFFF